MPTVKLTVEIARPPELVAAALLDPDNAVHWMADLERFEVISGGPGVPGSVAHLHYIQKGRPYVLKDVLEEMVPDEYFRSRVEGDGLEARVETWLRATEDGTEVTLRWAGKGTRLITWLVLPFMRGAILRRSQEDFHRFKDLVETRGAHFSKGG
jgi:uncharacterized protein YndB with AHSA1/START domain